jgi:hypothetical protein
MAKEKIFENKIKDFLTTLPKTWFFKHWAGPYSTVGIPDIICCVNGTFIGIEVKAEDGHSSVLQERNIKLINESNGIGLIIYPKHFEWLKGFLRGVSEGLKADRIPKEIKKLTPHEQMLLTVENMAKRKSNKAKKNAWEVKSYIAGAVLKSQKRT